MIISKELIIANKKRALVVAELRAKNFRPFPKVAKVVVAGAELEDEEVGADDVADAKGGVDSDFDYLLGMALYSLTAEKVRRSSPRAVLTLLPGCQVARRARCEGRGAQRPSQALGTGSLGPRPRLVQRAMGRAYLPVLDRAVLTRRQALLDLDTVAKNKSIRAAKSKGKGKKQVAHSDDESEEFDYKPVKKAPAAAKAQPKAKPVPLPTSDASAMVEDSPAVAAKPKKVPVKKVASKKRDSSVVDDASPPAKPYKVAKKVAAVGPSPAACPRLTSTVEPGRQRRGIRHLLQARQGACEEGCRR